MISQRTIRCATSAIFAFSLLTGCKSKQDRAVDQAKPQAAAPGQAQQVVAIDKNGNTTTTTVQPPAQGQSAQAVTTTVTPANQPAANQPAQPPGYANHPAQAPGN